MNSRFIFLFLSIATLMTGCSFNNQSNIKESDITPIQIKLKEGYFDKKPTAVDFNLALVTLTYEESSKFHKYSLDDFKNIQILWIYENYSFDKEKPEIYPCLNERRIIQVGFYENSFETFRKNVLLLAEYSFVYDINYSQGGING